MDPDVFDEELDAEPLSVHLIGRNPGNVREHLPDGFRRHLEIRSFENFERDGSTKAHGFILGETFVPPEGGTGDWNLGHDGNVQAPSVRGSDLAGEPARRSFVEQLYGYCRWCEFLDRDPRLFELQEFHSRHKMTLLAHDPLTKNELGQRLAETDPEELPDFLAEYGTSFLEALGAPATRRRHQNVLEHLFGYLSEMLPEEERTELLDLVHAFGRGEAPLLQPLVALKKQFEERSIEWVSKQTYLNPTSLEVRLKGIPNESAGGTGGSSR